MEQRDQFVEYLKKTLMGPRNGDFETLRSSDDPSDFYTIGILFPQGQDTDRLLEEHPDVSTAGSGTEDDPNREDPISLSNSKLPSSAGLSFFLSGSSKFICEISAARYEKGDQESNWRRVPLPTNLKSEVITVEVDQTKIVVFDGLAYLNVVRRPCAGGEVITVAVVNRKKTAKQFSSEVTECLFQLALRVRPGSESTFKPYTQPFNSLVGEEEQELALLYRDNPTYAVGHGCSANWDLSQPNPSWIGIDFIPTVDVMGVTHELKSSNSNEKPLADKSEILKFDYLIHAKADDVASGFETFIDDYRAWISDRISEIQTLDAGFQPAAQKVVNRLNETVTRMKAGADLATNDRDVSDALRIANRVMKLHMKNYYGVVQSDQNIQSKVPEKWRPFQLAFILNILPSIVDEENVDRDLVDLIWFPTGGGKTEAYFGAMAFEIALRRIRYGDKGNGTAVISRYTLTLLVTQQFQRTASLVCAMEWLRKNGPDQIQQCLGNSRITLGLWIGGDHTPNSNKEAKELLSNLRSGSVSELVVQKCPWCGMKIIPETPPGDGRYGFVAEETYSYVRCMDAECYFSERLPIQFVDPMLYEDPPTILMGTVDKFARLPWVGDAHSFFGSENIMPPGLIIQDEMHLLSGPLGTLFGIYEAGIEAIIRLRGGNPKIIAATATIRDAASQSKGLFGRDVRVFPPPGLSQEDSYFARAQKSDTRKYIGLMSPHSTGVTSLIRSVATLAQCPKEITFTPDYLDGYWTQVVFHNSLRELGNFLTYCEDDIPDRIRVIAKDQAHMREIGSDNVLQASSNIESKYEALSKMQVPKTDPEVVSIVACSNMFSAGVDIPRLALMLVNGQPKSASEYIQATSRIGRGKVPGIVVTHFSASKARDRSHYESFASFHRSFYRYVEPTSVTSMSMPARQRGLHAAFVMAVRIGLGFTENNSAGDVPSHPEEVMRAFNELVSRCSKSDEAYSQEIEEDLKKFKSFWFDLAEQGRSDDRRLSYESKHRSPNPGLLKTTGMEGAGRDTQHSLRNVDRSVRLQVRKGMVKNG